MSDTIHGRRSSIDVFIRVRPMRAELLETRPGWDVSGTTLREKGNPDSLFTFDHIYGPSSTTQELYEQSVRDSIIANVAKGYNGTVFMYGQTGSGKTYTMFGGGSGSGPSNPEGLVPLAARGLFAELEREQQRNPSMKVEVFVTMIELYNEQLRDLLLLLPGAVAPPLSIRENEYGVYVHNAIRQRVGSARECVQLIYAQAERRTNASTSMNERSSRSHCVICIHVEKTIYLDGDSSDASSDNEEDDTVTGGSDSILKKKIVSTLNLVDLAGSERVAKTGSTGVRMIEGGHINKSLTILTTVINRLTEGGPGAFVPYRDSRLTHLLKTAIGGNSLTAVFCCITPAVQHVDETRSTLLFAARAKTIKNNVTVNEVADPKAKLRTMELELRRYKRMLVAMTVQLWSRTVRVRNLEQQLQESRSTGIFSSSSIGNSGTVRMASATPEPHASLVEQQRLIIAQLTQRNEALLQELSEARDWAVSSFPSAAAAAAPGSGISSGFGIGLADDEEKQQLRADARDLEQMLREALDEKSAIQQSMDELDAFSRELEEENAAQAESLKSLQATCRELQTLIDAKGSDEGAARADATLLREQLSRTQAKLLEKSRGDEYLQQLTRLHIEHQEAQFAHHQSQAQHARQMDEAQARIKELDEKLEDLEDAKEELRDANKLQNSLLWRLLSVASLVTRGHAVDPDETATTVREAQVEAAVKILTTTVLAAIDKAPVVLESSEGRRQKRQQSQPQQEDSTTTAGTGDEALRQRVRQLEQELVAKDAQRDVIIDTKLKRIQGLVLKLHTANAALKEEMKRCFELNGNLFQFIDKHPKLASKLSDAGLVPISLKAALERVILANIPQKPYGHN